MIQKYVAFLIQFHRRTLAAQIHFVAFIAAIVGLIVFCVHASIRGEHLFACIVFGVTAILVMGVSAFYHFWHDGFSMPIRFEKKLEDLDHISIYLFIAGTYTPFLMNAVTSHWRTPLLILIWACAITGSIYTLIKPRLPLWARSRWVYTGLFVLMGWTMMVRIGEISTNLSESSLFLLIGGALAYTIGAIVYAMKWPNPIRDYFGFHELWHVAVVAGFSFHYAMIMGFYGV